MKELHTEIEIEAPPEKVWHVLSDFSKYEEWNPFILKVSGTLREGGYLTVHLMLGGEERVIQPGIVRYRENREFSWLGTWVMPGLVDGEHIYRLEPLDVRGTLFIHREEFRGLLVPFIWGRLERELLDAFTRMNLALKERVEQMPNA